jgi:hypothetical protein
MEHAITLEALANESRAWDAELMEVPLLGDDVNFTEDGSDANFYENRVPEIVHEPESAQTLHDLMTISRRWNDGISALELVPGEFSFGPEGLLQDGQVLRVEEDARKRLYHSLDAPGVYLEKQSPGLRALALTEHARRGDFGTSPMALVRDDELINIFEGGLSNLTPSDVVGAVGEELGAEGADLKISRIDHDLDRLELEIVSPSKATEVRAGDTIEAGLSIIHSRSGSEAIQIKTFMLRLICTNGLVHRECDSEEHFARTRRLPANHPHSRELQLDQIRRLTRWNWDKLQGKLEAIGKAAQRPAEVEDLLEKAIRRARLSWPRLRNRLLSAWHTEGAEDTYWGAVNALTRVSTHERGVRLRVRRHLATLAGVLAFSHRHVCPLCYSVIARPASEHKDAA